MNLDYLNKNDSIMIVWKKISLNVSTILCKIKNTYSTTSLLVQDNGDVYIEF